MHDSICRVNSGMSRVLGCVNSEPAGMAFIVDKDDKLIGVITDGDFRRLLLGGKQFNQRLNIKDLGSFVSALATSNLDDLIKLSSKKIRIIPLVDDQGILVDYFRHERRSRFMPVAEPNIQQKEFDYLLDAFMSTWISSKGAYIDRFEEEFAHFCDCTYGVSTSNGTAALHLALMALGIGPGDEVILPDLTFAACANVVLFTGAKPVLVDVELDTWTIDPDAMAKAITPKTKAIMVVHLYGQPGDMEAIMKIAKKHNLLVVEDCAEAHGAKFKDRIVGSIGDVGCFSFYGNKILTTGEGGMCVTNNEDYAKQMRILRDHGMSRTNKYWHEAVGFNYRMTNLQAAIGVAQLESIKERIQFRKKLEDKYRKCLSLIKGLEWQKDVENRERVVWLVSVLTKKWNREELINTLKNNQIDTRPFFYPLSSMEIYKKYTHSSKNSHEISRYGLNLPTHENVNVEAIANVLGSQ